MENYTTGPTFAYTSSSPIPHPRLELLALPTEIIDTIISYLNPFELVRLALVCHKLLNHTIDDMHWQRHVLSNLPGNKINSPYPCKTWRELFIAHNQHWFLTKHKLWFGDRSLAGQMVIARFDARRGCIEGYQLLATRSREGSEPWIADPTVHIHYFEPDVKLHLDKPVLQFDVVSLENIMHRLFASSAARPARRFFPEHPMRYNHGSDPRFSTFMFTKALEEPDLQGRSPYSRFPYGRFPYDLVWPPPAVPASQRVIGHPTDIAGSQTDDLNDLITSPKCRPFNRSEVSDMTFRIRQWMELGPPTMGFHVGEEIVTYSTIDPVFYTPTPERPWRGIWVGDYSVHGCEFLLINQPDVDGIDYQVPLTKLKSESEEEFQARLLSERVYQGRLDAIKLTGDPNVPRGEYTFLVDDLGEDGFVGFAHGTPFQGARIVKSKGHIARIGFRDDKYIESRLILISHNRLAQYWVDFGHISFFERVDIDQLLVPS